MSNGLKKQENHKNHFSRDVMLGGGDLWTDGLICAFEFVRSRKKTTKVQSKSGAHHLLVEMPEKQVSTYDPTDYNLSKSPPIIDFEVSVKDMLDDHNLKPGGREEALPRSYWVPIGWDRISELVRSVQVDAGCWEPIDFFQDEEDDVTVADLAAPYWERPVGPTWWCHVAAAHPFVNAWLRNAQWIHPAICIALRDESKLISERMKHLLYEVNCFACLVFKHASLCKSSIFKNQLSKCFGCHTESKALVLFLSHVKHWKYLSCLYLGLIL